MIGVSAHGVYVPRARLNKNQLLQQIPGLMPV